MNGISDRLQIDMYSMENLSELVSQQAKRIDELKQMLLEAQENAAEPSKKERIYYQTKVEELREELFKETINSIEIKQHYESFVIAATNEISIQNQAVKSATEFVRALKKSFFSTMILAICSVALAIILRR